MYACCIDNSICLNVKDRSNALASFDELYDMPEQDLLREDCHSLVDQIGNDEEEKLSVASDLESILTFFCKSHGISYQRNNGWLEILQPMLALKLSKSDLYNLFYAFVSRYIPRDCNKNGKPFHLFRLLLQYHDPELCSFLDTRKIAPDTYAISWFRSLFASQCDLKVILNMWDVYLQHTDPFLAFFLTLVILVNAKEQLITMKDASKHEIIEKLITFPSGLEADDIEDFCSLAQYYASKTPQSFRQDFGQHLFRTSATLQKVDTDSLANYALCLPVSVKELVETSQTTRGDMVRYFVVDCRPAEQYNSGHLPTAFHLDANLMLQSPIEFATAVQTLLTAQKQALAAGSAAGGEHLCFMGSGREEEDQYVNMVVARFLQQNSQYVSLAHGGYSALHEMLDDHLQDGLMDHNQLTCIVCNPMCTLANGVEYDYTEEYSKSDKGESLIDSIAKLSDVVKSKSAVVKSKMINYIKNEQPLTERHVSSEDRVGKRYRNTQSVFTIGDDDEDACDMISSDDEHRDVVNVNTWLHKPDVKFSYPCQHIKETGFTYNSYLMVTDTHLFILRLIPEKKGMAWVQARRALGNVVKITSKKRTPDLITFKYGYSDDQGIKVTDMDRLIIPKAAEATKNIRQQILAVLDSLDAS
ncbi:hypothetical protein LSH36_5g02007 [Paralvinella palmiformis]|uniref:TBC1 domain family member 23 n=1 Tax=Paralvinella palmiformis TaxID=53620 RepID=A0AAD9KG98_9ANNE|nr:hypothetical protein LSH36_5g02007 [Paralvinella palmiformis]